jgi:hypothetical protein
MKTTVSLLLLLSFSLYSCLGKVVAEKSDEFKLSKEKFSFIQEYETPENIHLTLGTTGGNIDVKGYEGNRVKVAFVVTKNNGEVLEMTLDELQKYATFVITKEGQDLSIQVKEILKRNLSVGFIVQAPVKTTSTISTSGGNLTVEGLDGSQEMHTSGGNIDLENCTGSMDAETSGGNIGLENLTGQLNVSTSGGNIDGENLVGELKAETSGGNISLENLKGVASVSTSGGNIDLKNISGSMCGYTSGGNISAKMVTLSEKLVLETNGGDIDCTLPKGIGLNLELTADGIETTLENFKGTSKKEQIIGQINGGGIPVKISTPSGRIDLRYK